mgnify:CR=1 FL=1
MLRPRILYCIFPFSISMPPVLPQVGMVAVHSQIIHALRSSRFIPLSLFFKRTTCMNSHTFTDNINFSDRRQRLGWQWRSGGIYWLLSGCILGLSFFGVGHPIQAFAANSRALTL